MASHEKNHRSSLHDKRMFPHTFTKIDWSRIEELSSDKFLQQWNMCCSIVKRWSLDSTLEKKFKKELCEVSTEDVALFFETIFSLCILYSLYSFAIDLCDVEDLTLEISRIKKFSGSLSEVPCENIDTSAKKHHRPIITVHQSFFRTILRKVQQTHTDTSCESNTLLQSAAMSIAKLIETFLHEMYHLRQMYQNESSFDRSTRATKYIKTEYKQDWGERGARGYSARALREMNTFLFSHSEFTPFAWYPYLTEGLAGYTQQSETAKRMLNNDPWLTQYPLREKK